jgi:hypothetical protein
VEKGSYHRNMCVDLDVLEAKKESLTVRSMAKNYVGLAVMARDMDNRDMIGNMFCPLCGNQGMIWERTKIGCQNPGCPAHKDKISLGEWGMLMALKEIKVSQVSINGAAPGWSY